MEGSFENLDGMKPHLDPSEMTLTTVCFSLFFKFTEQDVVIILITNIFIVSMK